MSAKVAPKALQSERAGVGFESAAAVRTTFTCQAKAKEHMQTDPGTPSAAPIFQEFELD